jgi:hypothetical protein
VDRNDKVGLLPRRLRAAADRTRAQSRVCVPGSVQVVGRRQIESYSKLIHTVDHVEG